jgi:hypothetical protein
MQIGFGAEIEPIAARGGAQREKGYINQATATLTRMNITNVQMAYWTRRFVDRRAIDATAMEMRAAKISMAGKWCR